MIRFDRRAAGIAMIAASCTALLSECFRKKGPSLGTLAVLAAEGALGLYLLDENKVVEGKIREQAKKVATAVQMPVGCDEDEEIFESDEDVTAAEEAISDELAADEQA
jgi:hypothetical protein